MSYSFGKKLKWLRTSKKLTQEGLARALNLRYGTNFNKGMISKWENDKEEPRMDSIRYIADFFNISLDEILGLKSDPVPKDNLPDLTEKDERDIQKELENLIKGLKTGNGFVAFGGMDIDELDEEDRELLIASLENSLRLAKRIAKEKFTPKKHRKE
ncbi:helix-turn-helix domain-containing protein [Anoxybacillus salavatliensis]|uniref:helix-turn-helix domain-containing protein n=1 Tax=Anoxybacillus gonensis TaxID=198467 RepID=UPI00214AF616|nr:helix-turn-helix transcriptional regulator [Anoxybacillus gonensis]MCQ5364761.1 helix-turn-helix domain-containing protein [Anoxybacillus gonensis]